jgi:toluene monooxygenase system ferredoxin subunit
VAFVRACDLDDVWEGEMTVVTVAGCDVLLVHLNGGGIRAFDARCPHQAWSLGEGELDGDVLTCSAHGWQFDVRDGAGVNPAGCGLAHYAVEVRGAEVWVDVASSEAARGRSGTERKGDEASE